MINRHSNQIGWLLSSIFLALILSIIPLPSWAIAYQPHWLLIVISYWLLVCPNYLGLGGVCLLGLLLDILTGVTLGKQAFALTVIAYLFIKFQPQLRFFSFWQRLSIMVIISFLYSTLLYAEQGLIGQLTPKALFWLPLVTTLFFWPAVYGLLQYYCRFHRPYE